MRITSFAPSMTQPTYAVSSAPQGTFGASTPVVRSVAPAATETQRSGGLPTLPQVVRAGRKAGILGLAGLSSLLVGCGKDVAQLAESLGTKVAKPAETSLAGILTPPAGLNILESLVPNSIATGLGADSIATVPGSLAPNAGGTVTGGVSTVVDKVLSNTPSAAADSCPATTQSGMIRLLEDNLLTSIPTNHLKPAPLTDCLLDLKELDPGAAAPFESKLQDRLVLLGSADGGGASGGSSDGLCRKAEGWIALRKSEVAKRAGSPLSPNAEEKASAGFDYETLYNSVVNRYTKPLICPILETFLEEPNVKNIEAGVTGAGNAYTRYLEEEAARNLFSF